MGACNLPTCEQSFKRAICIALYSGSARQPQPVNADSGQPMASGINIYSFFQSSKIPVFPDI